MLPTVNIHKIRDKRSRFGFLMRTRDCCDLTLQTIPPLLAEKDIDVYWVDGSVTPEGQALATSGWRDMPGLCEVHVGATHGPMGSWLYGLRQLLQHRYEYVGFIEGDVLLEPGWFQAMCALYARGEQDGLHVGSVSARCIADRILVPRDGYAVMANLGAGMAMYREDVFLKVLYDKSNCVLVDTLFLFSELRAQFRELCGLDYPFTWRVTRSLEGKTIQPGALYDWKLSHDWWREVVLLKHGMVALATTPALARNIDPDGMNDKPMMRPTVTDPVFDWASFTARLDERFKNPPVSHMTDEPARQTGTE